MKVKSEREVAQLCLPLCDPMDWSLPGSSIHGFFQARVLEWGAIAFSRIPVELFQILKDDAVKVLHSICQQIWKTQQWLQDWKRSIFIPIPKKGNAKECSNYRTIAFISHASKVMLKILQARLQQYMNHELPDVQASFRKAEEPEIKLPTSTGSSKKQENSRKTSISAFLTMPKPLTCGSQ